MRANEITGRLVREGYIQQYPLDPGFEDLSGNYLLVSGLPNSSKFSFRVFCRNHGMIRTRLARGDSPREQLMACGVTDANLLAIASPEFRRGRSQQDPASITILGELDLLMLLIVGLLCYLHEDGRTPLQNGMLRTTGFLSCLLVLILSFQLVSAVWILRGSISGAWILGGIAYLIGD
jgi:hypothetical protein